MKSPFFCQGEATEVGEAMAAATRGRQWRYDLIGGRTGSVRFDESKMWVCSDSYIYIIYVYTYIYIYI